MPRSFSPAPSLWPGRLPAAFTLFKDETCSPAPFYGPAGLLGKCAFIFSMEELYQKNRGKGVRHLTCDEKRTISKEML